MNMKGITVIYKNLSHTIHPEFEVSHDFLSGTNCLKTNQNWSQAWNGASGEKLKVTKSSRSGCELTAGFSIKCWVFARWQRTESHSWLESILVSVRREQNCCGIVCVCKFFLKVYSGNLEEGEKLSLLILSHSSWFLIWLFLQFCSFFFLKPFHLLLAPEVQQWNLPSLRVFLSSGLDHILISF